MIKSHQNQIDYKITSKYYKISKNPKIKPKHSEATYKNDRF